MMLVLQVAILVAIACCFHWLFRRRPSVQYFVWLATIVSVGLAIPLQSQVPSLKMEIPVVAQQDSASPSSNSFVAPEKLTQPETTQGIPVLPQNSATQYEAVSLPHAPSSSASVEKLSTQINPWQWFAIAYVTIVIALVLRLLAGIWALQRLTKDARKVQLSGIAAEAIAQQLGLRRNVCVMVSDRVKVPMAFGVMRPTVLLPKCFEAWSEEAQQAVLLHEFMVGGWIGSYVFIFIFRAKRVSN